MYKLLCPLAVFAACTSSPQSTGIEPMTCDPASTLTYASFGATFMENHCLSCHTNKESPVLASQTQIRQHAAQILQEAVYTDAMPEDADLSIAEREQLGQWLACGAP